MSLIPLRSALAAGMAALVPALLVAQNTAGARVMDKMDHPAMAKGDFVGDDGHRATGSYQISEVGGKLMLTTSDDFNVDERAPDVYVVLSNLAKVGKENAIWLGKIKSHEGVQSFEIPVNAKFDGLTTVVLWCKKYAVTIGTARLDAAGLMHDAMNKDAMKKPGSGPEAR